MATAATSSFGTFIKVGDGATSETFTTIAEVKDISGPSASLDTEEVTNHSSPSGWDEHVATILRGGDVTFDLNYLPTAATQNASTGLTADKNARTLRNFELVFTDSSTTTYSFAAFVKGVSPSAPVSGSLSASVTLGISGPITQA